MRKKPSLILNPATAFSCPPVHSGGLNAFIKPLMDADFIGSGCWQLRHWKVRGGSPLG
jgi:hypothetical protein